MRKSYLDYAMSVIHRARGCPMCATGLKPVQRPHPRGHERPRPRFESRLPQVRQDLRRHFRQQLSSARRSGDLSGDGASRAGLQMRYPLVDGQGNFGSVDGDPPAAMRTPKHGWRRFQKTFSPDLEKETVDFIPNFDQTREEPVVLPSRFPIYSSMARAASPSAWPEHPAAQSARDRGRSHSADRKSQMRR